MMRKIIASKDRCHINPYFLPLIFMQRVLDIGIQESIIAEEAVTAIMDIEAKLIIDWPLEKRGK